jgi:hypothetical protein
MSENKAQNAEVSPLEATSAQAVQVVIRELSERLRGWWKTDGLGYTSDIQLTETGMFDVKFSCSFGSHIEELVDEEDASLPKEERHAKVLKRFEDLGLVLHAEYHDELSVKDCDASRDALTRMVKEKFPSCVVRSIDVAGTRNGVFIVRAVHVLIRDLAEVYVLPKPTKDLW